MRAGWVGRRKIQSETPVGVYDIITWHMSNYSKICPLNIQGFAVSKIHLILNKWDFTQRSSQTPFEIEIMNLFFD